MTLVEFASTFVAFKAKRCKPATVAEYQRILKLRLLPRFDARDLRRISISDAALLHAEPARNFPRSGESYRIGTLSSSQGRSPARIEDAAYKCLDGGQGRGVAFVRHPESDTNGSRVHETSPRGRAPNVLLRRQISRALSRVPQTHPARHAGKKAGKCRGRDSRA